MEFKYKRTKSKNPVPTDVGVLLERVLGGQMDGYLLVEKWTSVVGERVAKHLQLLDLQGNTLVLKASSAPWQSEANLQKKAIIDGCNAVLGKDRVRNIRFG